MSFLFGSPLISIFDFVSLKNTVTSLNKLILDAIEKLEKNTKYIIIGASLIVPAFVIIRFYRLDRKFLFSFTYRRKLHTPKCFPVYVEHSTTLKRLESSIIASRGVIIYWAPHDAGKSTYTKRICNKLYESSKLGGIIKIKDDPYGGNSADWFNGMFGSNYFNLGDKFSDLIGMIVDLNIRVFLVLLIGLLIGYSNIFVEEIKKS